MHNENCIIDSNLDDISNLRLDCIRAEQQALSNNLPLSCSIVVIILADLAQESTSPPGVAGRIMLVKEELTQGLQ
jgi:hypothetical protein